MFSGELEFLGGRQVEVGAKFDNPLRWWKNFSQLKTWQTKWNFFVSFIMGIEVELKVGHSNGEGREAIMDFEMGHFSLLFCWQETLI